MQKNEHPVSVYSNGGLYGLTNETKTPGKMVYGDVEVYGSDKTSQETPNTQIAVYKYSDGKMIEFECRGRFTNHEGSQGQEVGNIFYGTEGWLEIYGDNWKAFRQRERQAFAGSKEGEKGRSGNHWANFIEAIRSGKNEDMHSDILVGHMSTTLPHLANISYRVGRELKFMGEYEKFANDAEADALLTRVYRHPYVVPENV
jgi:hypothetical protein